DDGDRQVRGGGDGDGAAFFRPVRCSRGRGRGGNSTLGCIIRIDMSQGWRGGEACVSPEV
ncbi:MAG: hypothetical protein MPJ22_01085, partial [Pirellulales bacterium]|nr:hypothetical protein [Pirellulales bacterium]